MRYSVSAESYTITKVRVSLDDEFGIRKYGVYVDCRNSTDLTKTDVGTIAGFIEGNEQFKIPEFGTYLTMSRRDIFAMIEGKEKLNE
jgi:hypothetical protein